MSKEEFSKENIEMAIKNTAKKLYDKKGELSQDKFAIELAKFIGASHQSDIVKLQIMAIIRLLDEDNMCIAKEGLDTDKSLDELLPISDDMLINKKHTLKTKVFCGKGERKLIYGHLEKFKEQLLRRKSDNDRLKKALADTSEDGLKQRIRKIKLYTPGIKIQPIINNINDISDLTIIKGERQGKSDSSNITGIRHMIYVRNEGFTQNVPVREIIEEIQGYGLSKNDAGKLFVVIAGLPMTGIQDPKGERLNVGSYASYGISNEQHGLVECFCFNRNQVWIGKDSVDIAMPAMTISNE